MPTSVSAVGAGSEAPHCDVAILGGGIAGLSLALSLPAGLRVTLVTKAALGESNTRYAQGGLAAAVGADDDAELHLRDTVAAGAGLVDERAARVLVTEAREAVAWLIAAGTHFDERPDASPARDDGLAARYDLTREAAHSRRRVLHARDATGAEIERALVAAMRARQGAHVLEHTQALELVVRDGACAGVDVLHDGQVLRVLASRGVALANGGAGQLWLRTSNPLGATADGFALAWRAGVALADLEFAQFHPTVLVPPNGDTTEAFLISEAVRGEGAWLRNQAGERFLPRYAPEAELAPRDVVARAILSEMLAEGAPSAFLDLRHLRAAETHTRFPTIAAVCRRYGLDLARDLIPVAPAAHYFMGGVAVDAWARTTLPGLYAVGEVACTGVHGANRLASNSLLEGLVFGRRAARLLARTTTADAWPSAPTLPGDVLTFEPLVLPVGAHAAPIAEEIRAGLRRVMWQRVSLRRDEAGLAEARRELRALAAAGPVDPETANMLLVAQLITEAAQARREKRRQRWYGMSSVHQRSPCDSSVGTPNRFTTSGSGSRSKSQASANCRPTMKSRLPGMKPTGTPESASRRSAAASGP
ncbi:MAG: L-aspartate oxidase [Ktedonobacterales bacterium]|nr:L-aspartate oxidase [Ktedonobacterales bacterium]